MKLAELLNNSFYNYKFEEKPISQAIEENIKNEDLKKMLQSNYRCTLDYTFKLGGTVSSFYGIINSTSNSECTPLVNFLKENKNVY